MSAGKGDKPRQVNKQKYDDNFAEIFGEYVPLWRKKSEKGRQRKKVGEKLDEK